MKKNIYHLLFLTIGVSILSSITYTVDAQDLFEYKSQVQNADIKQEQVDEKKEIVIIDNAVEKNVEEVLNESSDTEILFEKEEEKKVYIDPWPSIVQAIKPDYIMIDEGIENGKNVNSPIVDTNNLLILGAMQNDLNKVALSLKYNSNVTIPNKYGATALHWAAAKSRYEIVTMILMAGNKDIQSFKKLINYQDKNGKTPLHYASQYSYNNLNTKLLLKNSADHNLVDNEGRTALHYAVTSFHWDIAEELLKNGAKFDMKDNNNLSIEELFLERADVNTMIKLYSYLSAENKTRIRIKLKNLRLSFDKNNNIVLPTQDSSIEILPPLRITK